MKPLFKTVRVVYDAQQECFDVQYRNWFFWQHYRSFKFDRPGDRYPIHYTTREEAEQRAIEQAKKLLRTVEIFRETKIPLWITGKK